MASSKDVSGKILVGNLVSEVTADTIRDLFSKADGTILDVEVPLDRRGKSVGYAFVFMATKVEAQEAIKQLDGLEVGGRRLNISLAESENTQVKNPKKWYLFGY